MVLGELVGLADLLAGFLHILAGLLEVVADEIQLFALLEGLAVGLHHNTIDALKPRVHLQQGLFPLLQESPLELIVELLCLFLRGGLLMGLLNSGLVEEAGDLGALIKKLVASNHEFLGYFGVEVAFLAAPEGCLDGGYLLLALAEEQEGLLVLVEPDELGDALPCPLEGLH
jgi:hypothetical protein